jgi:hypothetical protein|tara:strand:+ start:5864 stop:6625 length:762 start_codon:yes stop_codon:yes gene_type:complete
MDNITVARSMRGSLGMLAMAWLMAPSTQKKAAAAGMGEGQGAYAVGRLGVLGNCPVDNVVAAAFFWAPDHLRSKVEEGRSVFDPMEGAKVYARICQEYGAEALADFEGNERLGELLQQVVQNAAPHGVPTFVGWRDQQLPSDVGAARTFQLAQCMRELRFGRHAVAVQALGMGPLEAILSGPAGEWNAEFFGWPKPYPDVSTLAAHRDEIESLTDRLHGPDFECLTDDERAEVRDLSKAARSHATSRAEAANI